MKLIFSSRVKIIFITLVGIFTEDKKKTKKTNLTSKHNDDNVGETLKKRELNGGKKILTIELFLRGKNRALDLMILDFLHTSSMNSYISMSYREFCREINTLTAL